MKSLFVCYPKCTTCGRARKWLNENDFAYEERDIKTDNPTKEELTEWIEASGLPIKRFFNTSGMKYRELKLKDKLEDMTDEEKIDLLASDGMLVKRPILINEKVVLVAFKEKEWEEKLK